MRTRRGVKLGWGRGVEGEFEVVRFFEMGALFDLSMRLAQTTWTLRIQNLNV